MVTKYFILVKKRGAKKWQMLVRARKNATLTSLKKNAPKVFKGFTTRIITKTQAQRFLKGIQRRTRKPRTKTKTRMKRKRVRHKKR